MFKQKLIYVCSPLRGNIEKNIIKAKEYCQSVILSGNVPIAPHVALYGVLDDNKPIERETALALGQELLHRCDELWAFGDVVSEGMEAEITLAKQIGKPVKTVLFDSEKTPEQAVHEVKILSKYFEQVKSGAKTFEYREDDRGYKVGDIIRLMEYQLESNTYTGNSLEAEITYILKGGEFNIPTGYAIMSIKKVIGANTMNTLSEKKTFLTDFSEKFPNAKLNNQGSPNACVEDMGYIDMKPCNHECTECWNTPLEE